MCSVTPTTGLSDPVNADQAWPELSFGRQGLRRPPPAIVQSVAPRKCTRGYHPLNSVEDALTAIGVLVTATVTTLVQDQNPGGAAYNRTGRRYGPSPAVEWTRARSSQISHTIGKGKEMTGICGYHPLNSVVEDNATDGCNAGSRAKSRRCGMRSALLQDPSPEQICCEGDTGSRARQSQISHAIEGIAKQLSLDRIARNAQRLTDAGA
ncbi:hypothetical protein V8D89_007419 [Ganoderma adspersum]